MVIADRLKINLMQSINKTKQILVFLFLLCFAFILNASPQTRDIETQLEKAQADYDNGDYVKALDLAQNVSFNRKQKGCSA